MKNSWGMGYEGHTACMGEENICRTLVGISECKKGLGRPECT